MEHLVLKLTVGVIEAYHFLVQGQRVGYLRSQLDVMFWLEVVQAMGSP